MRKDNLLFKISFISYIGILFAMPYITARTWADIVLIIFIMSVVYQLNYLIQLRRDEKVSHGRNLARFLLYLLISISIYILIKYGQAFFFGYVVRTWFESQYVGTYYGVEAWGAMMESFVYIPTLAISGIYSGLYMFITRKYVD